MYAKSFAIIGIISIVVSGISIGAWTEGNQQRGNYHSETNKHRSFRTTLGLAIGLIGVILLSKTGFIYFLY